MGTVRDALAIIASADRGDDDTVRAFLAAYHGPGTDDRERGQLAGSCLSLAVLILRTCASASGIPTDRILGSVAACLEGATGDQAA